MFQIANYTLFPSFPIIVILKSDNIILPLSSVSLIVFKIFKKYFALLSIVVGKETPSDYKEENVGMGPSLGVF